MQRDAERLQKFLARAGIASRRKSEDLIRAGRVTVNGVAASLGQKIVSQTDQVRVDGELVSDVETNVYILLNKPTGVLSSRKSQGGHPTVIELLEINERVYPVGRLDLESQGLMLLTNDGDLAHRISHPRYGHEKEYRVLLNRFPDGSQLKAWRSGVVLSTGERTAPAKVYVEKDRGDQAWIRVTMRQGMKRQIRMTARALGLRVRKLIRVRMGLLRLHGLRVGEWRHLSPKEVADLKAT
jgi:23S rRNA pseudouridine2605 synthase